MLSHLQRHLSYANVVATAALFVALGGSGYAASKSGGGAAKAGAVVERRAKPAPSDRRLRNMHLTASASASAYGSVNLDAQLSRSLNVTGVTRPSTGLYCIQLSLGIDPTRRTVVASPDFNNDATTFNNSANQLNGFADRQAVVEVAGSTPGCGNGLTVLTGIRYADGRMQRANQGFSFSVPGSGLSPRTQIETSDHNSISAKQVIAHCAGGERAIGAGADINGAKSGGANTQLTAVVIDEISPILGDENNPGFVQVTAYEKEPTDAPWSIIATAVCVKAAG